MKWEGLERCESTQTEVRTRLDQAPDLESFGVYTLHQSAGHGRNGKEWIGVRGNLAFSVVLKERLARATFWPLLSGLALWKTLKEIDPKLDLGLKWPNDIYSGNSKIAGILVDRIGGVNPQRVIIGVGLNIGSGPELEAQKTTYLRALTSAAFDVSAFLNRWTNHLEDLCAEDPQTLVELAESIHIPPLGTEVRLLDGDRVHSGELLGLGEWGDLRLRTKNGPQSFTSGSLRWDGDGKPKEHA